MATLSYAKPKYYLKRIVIVGSGLAGLISSILLRRSGFEVLLIEKKTFPFHRVCGEYISAETIPFLKKNGLYPHQYDPPAIQKLIVSSTKGSTASIELPLGGFGISRYSFDYFLYSIAKDEGVNILEGTQVESITFSYGYFQVNCGTEQHFTAPIVIGSYGKRSRLDKTLSRDFINKRSPFVGVKYHIKTDFPSDTVALHNFEGGYCGISKIENNQYNLCYLARRSALKNAGSIPTLESQILAKNKHLKALLEDSEFMFEKPEVINEISFEPKSQIENHILMIGDTAGLITPLCGNGMAMAIHSAKIVSDIIGKYWSGVNFDRFALEYEYLETWSRHFKNRLWVGRKSQNLFGTYLTSSLAVGILRYTPKIARGIIKRTHGESFN